MFWNKLSVYIILLALSFFSGTLSLTIIIKKIEQCAFFQPDLAFAEPLPHSAAFLSSPPPPISTAAAAAAAVQSKSAVAAAAVVVSPQQPAVRVVRCFYEHNPAAVFLTKKHIV